MKFYTEKNKYQVVIKFHVHAYKLAYSIKNVNNAV